MDLLLYISLAGVVLSLVLLFYFISKYVNTEDVIPAEDEENGELPDEGKEKAADEKKPEVLPPAEAAVPASAAETPVPAEAAPSAVKPEEVKPAEQPKPAETVPVQADSPKPEPAPVPAKAEDSSLFPDKPEAAATAAPVVESAPPPAAQPVPAAQPEAQAAVSAQAPVEPPQEEKHLSAVEQLAAAKPSFNLALAKAERVQVQPPPKDIEDLVKIISEVRSIIGRLDGMEPRFAVRLQPALRAIARELDDIKSEFGGKPQ